MKLKDRTESEIEFDSKRIRDAERKARYGHRDWIYWADRNGCLQIARQTPESIKQALLDTGTQGWFIQIGANDAQHYMVTWWIGINLLNQAKRNLGLSRKRL